MSHLDELLSAYLDGEATPAEAAQVASHLRDCVPCRRRLVDLNEARAAVRALPMLEMPIHLVPAPERGGRHRRWPLAAGAAAAMVAAVLAVASALGPPPEPIDLTELSLQVGARASADAGVAPLKAFVPTAVEE